MWSQAWWWEGLEPPHPTLLILEDFQIQAGEAEVGGWSPARLSVGGMAPGGAVMGSMAHGCSSLQGGGSNSGSMAHERQIVTGSLGTRWVSTEPPPGHFC